MGTNEAGNPILGVLIACAAATVLLAALTVWLGRHRKLSRRGSLAMAVVAMLPLFGAGFLMATKHQVEIATGETPSGKNVVPLH